MTPFETAALAAIRLIYATTIVYIRPGSEQQLLDAIPSETPANEFEGFNGNRRRVSFEIRFADLAVPPTKKDTIGHDGAVWRVNDINQRDDIASWVVFVERASL